MKRFTKTLFIVLVAVAFVATGCKKESEYKTVTLGAKIAANNSKVYIDGITPIWQTGDQVRVNGTDESHTITVSQISDNTAKLENVPQSDDGYYAIYPAEYATAFSGGQFAVTLPAFQEYTEVDGHQVVRAPMGAKTNGGSLTFHNLCSLLKVTVTAGETLKISEIKVTAGTTNLSGSTSTTLSGEGTYTLHAPATGSKSVTLSFGNTGKELTSGSYDFYIYLPAFNPQNVSVEVYNINANDVLGVKKQTFGDISVSANTINTVGTGSLTAASFTTTGALSGLFSVSADKKVRFSKGNLQYQASTSTWKFADQQYAFVGNAAGNTTAEANRATQTAWIDLFGWGTSGNNHGATAYQPYAISDDDAHYYAYNDENLNLYDNGGTADWGSNTIAGTTGTWRTLNEAEWGYLMDTRTTCNKVTHSYMKATINETTNGIIIFPDGYDFGENDATILGLISNYDAQDAAAIWATGTAWTDVAKISSASWTTLQNAGCVFLPAAGVRSDSYVGDVGTDGQYWSSSAVDASSVAWPSARFMFFSTRDVSPQSFNQRSLGQSVRLVQDY